MTKKPPLLWPPLENIAREISGIVEAADSEISQPDNLSGSLPQSIPDDIRVVLNRVAEARKLNTGDSPTSGDIVRISLPCTENPQASTSAGFLLDCQQESNPSVWKGWLVSPESDYAGPWDVLLDDRDGITDPLAGMVQTWHRVAMSLPAAPRILARMSIQRMQSIRAVSAEAQMQSVELHGAPGAGRPGLRLTLNGHTVVTGQPYVGEDDPRYRYHALYIELAKACLTDRYEVDNQPSSAPSDPKP